MHAFQSTTLFYPVGVPLWASLIEFYLLTFRNKPCTPPPLEYVRTTDILVRPKSDKNVQPTGHFELAAA